MVDSKTVYLQKHNIPELIDALINKLVDEEPQDPKAFLAKCLTSGLPNDRESSERYSVHARGEVDGAKLFQKLDFDTIGESTIQGDGKALGSIREQAGLDSTFQERLVDRKISEFERSYSYTLSNSNTLGIKGFTATLRVLSSTSPPTHCFVTWTAHWDKAGDLASLHLPSYIRELIEGAISDLQGE